MPDDFVRSVLYPGRIDRVIAAFAPAQISHGGGLTLERPLCGKRNVCTPVGWAAEACRVLGAVSRDEGGAVLVEYALLLALFTIACIVSASAIEHATFNALYHEQTELMSYALRNGT